VNSILRETYVRAKLHTFIVLIPNKDNPHSLLDFRLIQTIVKKF